MEHKKKIIYCLGILCMVVAVLVNVTGCKKENSPAEEVKVLQQAEHPAETAEQAAQKIPKDHPAH